jgi:hypothetical protein
LGLSPLSAVLVDGFRIMARRDTAGVRLLPGNDFTHRFPFIEMTSGRYLEQSRKWWGDLQPGLVPDLPRFLFSAF